MNVQLTGIVYSANAELAGRLRLQKNTAHFFIQSERNDLFTILEKKKKRQRKNVSVWQREQLQVLIHQKNVS